MLNSLKLNKILSQRENEFPCSIKNILVFYFLINIIFFL